MRILDLSSIMIFWQKKNKRNTVNKNKSKNKKKNYNSSQCIPTSPSIWNKEKPIQINIKFRKKKTKIQLTLVDLRVLRELVDKQQWYHWVQQESSNHCVKRILHWFFLFVGCICTIEKFKKVQSNKQKKNTKKLTNPWKLMWTGHLICPFLHLVGT